jgi:hypothetical protein
MTCVFFDRSNKENETTRYLKLATDDDKVHFLK